MNRYCVGPSMAVDWGDDGPPPAASRTYGVRAITLTARKN